MGHNHDHGHGHGHHHGPASYGWAFAIGISLNLGFVLIEFIFGKVAHSMALVADAGHNLGDVLGLFMAWAAGTLAQRRPTPGRTYGLRRSSILAALANAVVLLFALGAIAWEAVHRFSAPAPVAGKTVMIVAAIGIAINTGTALLFLSGRKHDLNLRAAFLHMAGDAGVSLTVLLSAWLLLGTGWLWIDPVLSLAIVAVILFSTWGLLRDSLNLALDAVPEGVNMDGIRLYLTSLPSVVDVHDLHVWGMSTTETALTAHLVLAAPCSDDAFLVCTERDLHDRFGIEHATIQLETADRARPCKFTHGCHP